MIEKQKLIAEVQIVHGHQAADALRQIKDDDDFVIRLCKAALSPEFVREKLEFEKAIGKEAVKAKKGFLV